MSKSKPGKSAGRSNAGYALAVRGGAGAGTHGDRRLKRQRTRQTVLRASLKDAFASFV